CPRRADALFPATPEEFFAARRTSAWLRGQSTAHFAPGAKQSGLLARSVQEKEKGSRDRPRGDGHDSACCSLSGDCTRRGALRIRLLCESLVRSGPHCILRLPRPGGPLLCRRLHAGGAATRSGLTPAPASPRRTCCRKRWSRIVVLSETAKAKATD